MIKRISFIVLLISLGLILVNPVFAFDKVVPQEVIKASWYVVKIKIISFEKGGWGSSYGQGSGFFVEPDKILTVSHVGKSLEELLGLWFSIRSVEIMGRSYPVVEVVKIDYSRELAMLKISQNFPSYVLEFADEAKVGDEVFFVGFSGEQKRIFSGKVAKIDGNKLSIIPEQGKEKLTLFGQALPGMSGGPILDRHGKVVGVIWGGVQTIVAGTPLEEIRKFLEENDDR